MTPIVFCQAMVTNNYVHHVKDCPNCGATCMARYDVGPNQICNECDDVLMDYWYLDAGDWKEEICEGTCQICGGEWAEDYTTCNCPEEWESPIEWRHYTVKHEM